MPLNLIQRAAEKLGKRAAVADNGAVPSKGETSLPIRPVETSGGGVERDGGTIAENLATPEAVRSAHLAFGPLRRAGMITPDNIASNLSNEFRRVKREVLNQARGATGSNLSDNLVMITSALPREGKTFTAFNLAMSLAAERDVHVLLIDGDPVRPSIELFFEERADRGLLDLLIGKYDQISDVIYRCEEAPNLSVIFAGTAMPNAPELMASRRMANLCVDLSTRYPDRIIIIDTPPVLASAEPGMIAMHVHQLIMVVAAERTDRADIQKAVDQVAGCPKINLLLNKAPTWNQLNRSAYYSYYRPAKPASS